MSGSESHTTRDLTESETVQTTEIVDITPTSSLYSVASDNIPTNTKLIEFPLQSTNEWRANEDSSTESANTTNVEDTVFSQSPSTSNSLSDSTTGNDDENTEGVLSTVTSEVQKNTISTLNTPLGLRPVFTTTYSALSTSIASIKTTSPHMYDTSKLSSTESTTRSRDTSPITVTERSETMLPITLTRRTTKRSPTSTTSSFKSFPMTTSIAITSPSTTRTITNAVSTTTKTTQTTLNSKSNRITTANTILYSSTTHDISKRTPPSSPFISEYSPSILNVDESVQVIQASIFVVTDDSLSISSCSLIQNDTVIPLKVRSLFNTNVTIEVSHPPKEGSYLLECTATIAGESSKLSASGSLRSLSFKEFVKVKAPFMSQLSASATQKIVNVVFSRLLDTSFEPHPYCIIDNDATHIYPATLLSLVVSCDISDLSTIGTYTLIAIRSTILQGSSIENQEPTTVHLEAASNVFTSPFPSTNHPNNVISSSSPDNDNGKTTGSPIVTPKTPVVTVTFTDNLMGLLITADGETFPIGYLNCTDVFIDVLMLGDGSTCSGSRTNMFVTFGTNAYIVPSRPIALRTSFFTQQFIADIPSIIAAPPREAVSPNFTVEYPKKVMPCTEEVNLDVKQITGNGNRNLTYSWKVIGNPSMLPLTTTMERTLKFRRDLIPGSICLTVTACNFATKCTTSDLLNITIDNTDAIFSVAISGPQSGVFPSMRVTFDAQPTFQKCGEAVSVVPEEVKYLWKLNNSHEDRTASYRIASHKYKIGDILPLDLFAIYKNDETPFQAQASATVQYIGEPLKIILDSYELTLPQDNAVFIDAGQSADLNTKNGDVSHHWSCINMSSSAPCVIGNGVLFDSPYLSIPAGVLSEYSSYLFTDRINASGLTENASCVVTVVGARTPKIRFVAPTLEKFNVDQYFRIQVFVSSSYGDLNTTWEVMDGGQAFFNLSSFLPVHWKFFDEKTTQTAEQIFVSLTIPPAGVDQYPYWSGLLPGRTYAIRLKAVNAAGTATSIFEFKTNSPPTKGKIDISPPIESDFVALTTQIKLSVGDGWQDTDEPLVYRFGVETLLVDNNSNIRWYPETLSSEHHLLLPAAWPEPHAACNSRIGYRALMRVCDRLQSCTEAKSEQFTVSHPKNESVVLSSMLYAINAEVDNQKIFSALDKLGALFSQRCNASLVPEMADNITLRLIHSLDETSDDVEFREVISAASFMLDSVSNTVLLQLVDLLNRYSMRGQKTADGNREKRSASTDSMLTSGSQMSSLLPTFDKFLLEDQNVVGAYFSLLGRGVAEFCKQLDGTSDRTLKTQGQNITYVQAQSLVTSDDDFTNRSFTMAGTTDKIISFDSVFRNRFSAWTCGGSALCNYACLATVRISMDVFSRNQYLSSMFFANKFSSINTNRSASNFYSISVIDPISGEPVPISGTYNISVPVFGYKTSNYYACFLFIAGNWDTKLCASANFGRKIDGKDYFDCQCAQNGNLSVFTISPPAPPIVSEHNEILFKFNMTTTSVISASQITTFIAKLAATSTVDKQRFQNGESTQSGVIQLTLRPPFTLQQMPNGYAVQAILRAVDVNSGFKPFDNISVDAVSYDVVIRNLTGSIYARKIIMKSYRNYATIVGNSSVAVAAKWKQSIANTLRISEYRIKNEQIFLGIVYNFTITVPFEEETNPLSAEEIAMMIQECTNFNELVLLSTTGEVLPIEPITDEDIVELRPIQESNALVVVLVIVVTTLVGLASIYIGGAVFVKLRTDRLVQAERQRALIIGAGNAVIPPPPQYPQNLQQPPEAQLNRRSNKTQTNHR